MTADSPYPATLASLERLIAFPTVSADSNLALVEYVEALLQKAGFTTHRLADPGGTKCGLAARIGGKGQGGVLLSAHSDVVPVAGQNWTRPPFQLTREDRRLFGRGTTDMKGFLASVLSLARRAGDAALSKPLMLVISYDEEVGCQGIRKMLPGFQQLGWSPDLCIVGEPTLMRPATGHKGKAALRAICRGVAGHSALAPTFVNALHLAADFISALRRIQDDYAAAAAQDSGYDLPYSTVHAGRLGGGTALNIVPDQAEIEFELRHLPSDDLAFFLSRLDQEIAEIVAPYRLIDPAAGIKVEVTNTYPGLHIAADDPAVRRVAGLAGCSQAVKVAFGTEAGFFAKLDIPTVVCGPGSMEGQGHKADEFIEIDQLAACDRMMDGLLLQLA